MNLSWFFYSIAATIFFGVSMTLYKLPSIKGHSRFAAAFWSLFTALILSVIFFNSYIPNVSSGVLWASFIWGIVFVSLMLLQMHILNYVEAGSIFPVTTTSSLVLAIFAGVFLFGESLSILQISGIVLAIFVVFSFLYQGKKIKYSSAVLSVGSIIILASAFNKLIYKFVADGLDIRSFLVYQYVFASVTALIVFFIFHRKNWKQHIFSGSIKIGGMIGIFGFLGAYSLLNALIRGPFTLITAIHSFYVFVIAFAGYFLLDEKITRRKIFLICLAVIAVLLMRLG